MSIEQRETLDAILRQAAFPPDASVDDQQRVLHEFLASHARCHPRGSSPAPPFEVMESIPLDLGYG